MTRLVAVVRWFHEREPVPSMVMVDAQTVKGGRYGPTFHQAGGRGGRTIGTKRTLLGRDPGTARGRRRLLGPPARRRGRPRTVARPDRRAAQAPGTEASARAWLEVASVGYLAWRAVA